MGRNIRLLRWTVILLIAFTFGMVIYTGVEQLHWDLPITLLVALLAEALLQLWNHWLQKRIQEGKS